ncbi:FixH family protein [Rufibacter quisquiliarum]|uniref:Nitrogen fixation protein FixH n=1 Tax=Rufibacter quisquiliarum TaxID=1549639 RepID=A0A839GZ96_9BACT|nr:FixH family protein [Rufibacter quisquiliarum]MBA9078991.1 nitrogen fixation protein FixH [Rufibacter quisquiliarum]
MSTHTTTTPVKQFSLLPYIIITAFILFGSYIGFMVYGAMQSEVNLVSKDYYAEELAYSQRMKQLQETQQLEQPIHIVSAEMAEQLVIQFPKELAKAEGIVHLFRPSDEKLDVVLKLELSPEGLQNINTASLAKGHWRVQVTGKLNGKEYYQAQDVTL